MVVDIIWSVSVSEAPKDPPSTSTGTEKDSEELDNFELVENSGSENALPISPELQKYELYQSCPKGSITDFEEKLKYRQKYYYGLRQTKVW